MRDERAYLALVDSSEPEVFARLLARPTADEERVLRVYFGDDRYQRLHELALRASAPASRRGPAGGTGPSGAEVGAFRGNVVVLPGIMGSELSEFEGGAAGRRIWLDLRRVALGQIERLRLDPADGHSLFDVRATGVLKSYYGEIQLALARSWNVRVFPFDWRRSLDIAADDLLARINAWFGPGVPVHLVAHSMGGLVARTFIVRHRERWSTMWDRGHRDPDPRLSRPAGARGGRLVMLGTPNHGSYLIPQMVTGLAGTIAKLARFDFRHSLGEIRRIASSFVGAVQMLPSLLQDPTAAPLYEAATYGAIGPSAAALELATVQHRRLREVVSRERLLYVAGCNQPTLAGIADYTRIGAPEAYLGTTRGDGSVSHALGLLDGVATYFVEEEHSALPSNAKVLGALDGLLERGVTTSLAGGQPAHRGTAPGLPRARGEAEETAADAVRIAAGIEAARGEELAEIDGLVRQVRARRGPSVARGDEAARIREMAERLSADGGAVSAESARVLGEVASRHEAEGTDAPLTRAERRATELILRDVVGGRAGTEQSEDRRGAVAEAFTPAIEVRLIHGEIQDTARLGLDRRPDPADAIAVGHYLGLRPQAGELAIDRAVSAALRGKPSAGGRREGAAGADLEASELLLTQYTDRGIIRGELGQPFLLEDPRPGAPTGRVVVVAGMGRIGTCGEPELTVLVRELAWALGRLGKRHLATLLIGGGTGNLETGRAIEAWMNGLRYALAGIEEDGRRLQRITFVERDALRLREIQEAILNAKESLERSGRLSIGYRPLTGSQLAAYERTGILEEKRRLERALESRHAGAARRPADPTRLTVSREFEPVDPRRATVRYAAITETAAVPERTVVIDWPLIEETNDQLAGEDHPRKQHDTGRTLESLIIPRDLRQHLAGDTPLVLLLDTTTARIHWEMIAQADPGRPRGAGIGAEAPAFDPDAMFLGTCRSLTRQLRTTFAAPPEPPPPPRRKLRVLVVADPAEDAHLPGAEGEGMAVADLFEAYNALGAAAAGTSPNRVEVVRLFGPHSATRTAVLRELTVRSYDVLHFAGHCTFDRDQPARSGWVFTGGARLSAYELQRIDRIPQFVFSNACESGITPDRAGERSAGLAPSFAESFFQQGVSNFVCTAWPIDDSAATRFALYLYARLLGLELDPESDRPRGLTAPQPMHLAMRDARLEIARWPTGRQTWGAYQHYGNPHFQLFEPVASTTSPPPAGASRRRRRKRG